VVTFRPEFAAPWVGRAHVASLQLNRFGRRQATAMVDRVTGGKALPKEIADQIIDRTDGVPLFIEELTKAVVESGVLTDLGDHFTVAGPVPPLAIPTSLNASLLARLDRLAPAREVAQIGAALGRQFSHELISAVAPTPRAMPLLFCTRREATVAAMTAVRIMFPPVARSCRAACARSDRACG